MPFAEDVIRSLRKSSVAVFEFSSKSGDKAIFHCPCSFVVLSCPKGCPVTSDTTLVRGGTGGVGGSGRGHDNIVSALHHQLSVTEHELGTLLY